MDNERDIDRYVDRYVDVWNERDPAARRRAIALLWDEKGVQTIETAQYRGHNALDARVTGAHDELVRDKGFVFRSAGDAVAHHDMIVFTSHMVPAAGGPVAWTGRTVLTLGANGLILDDRQFTLNTPDGTGASTRATAEDFVRRLGEGEPERIAALFAEHVDWLLDWPEGGHPAVPWIRPRSTRADVADHFREVAAFHVPGQSAGVVSHVLVDGAEAIVLGEIRQTVRATGRPYAARCALHLTVESGLITRYAVYEDSLTVAEALASR